MVGIGAQKAHILPGGEVLCELVQAELCFGKAVLLGYGQQPVSVRVCQRLILALAAVHIAAVELVYLPGELPALSVGPGVVGEAGEGPARAQQAVYTFIAVLLGDPVEGRGGVYQVEGAVRAVVILKGQLMQGEVLIASQPLSGKGQKVSAGLKARKAAPGIEHRARGLAGAEAYLQGPAAAV